MLVGYKNQTDFPSEDFVCIRLTCGGETRVSPEDFAELSRFRWTLKKSFYRYYVGRWISANGKRKFIFIHRVISRCPRDRVVHHINHVTTDNRRSNLQLLTDYEHKEYHSWR
jgi:hypothetical protein